MQLYSILTEIVAAVVKNHRGTLIIDSSFYFQKINYVGWFLYSKYLANFEAFGWVISLSIKLNEECKGGYRVSEKIKAAATIPESTRCAFVLVSHIVSIISELLLVQLATNNCKKKFKKNYYLVSHK